MYDIHCHLDHDVLKPRLKKIASSGLRGILTSGIEHSSWISNLAISREYNVNVSLGLHPFFVKDKKDDILELKSLLKHKSVKAIGEIGLDYYNDYVLSKDSQKEIFYEQLRYAQEDNLPVIIHCRKAYDDLYLILKEVPVPALIFHCFGGSDQDLVRMQEFNSYFSFGFPITNENNKKHKRLLKQVPLNRLLFETDSPYMKPKSIMSQENEYSDPSDISLVYNFAKDFLEIELEELKLIIERNVQTIWKDFVELSI